MSSIGSTSSSSGFQPLTVDHNGNDRYSVNGKDASEAEANKALASRGVVATHGQFRTTDGIDLRSNNTHAVTFSSDAPLPNVGGRSAAPGTLAQRAEWMASMSDGALMWNAMSTLAETAMRDMKDSKELKNALEHAKLETKKSSLVATERQIEAERAQAAEQLVIAIASAAVSFVAAGATANSTGFMGEGVHAAATQLGTLTSTAGNYLSKTAGAGREVDEQKLMKERLGLVEATIDQSIETAKNNYEESRELFKNALKIIAEHEERNTQVVQKITS